MRYYWSLFFLFFQLFAFSQTAKVRGSVVDKHNKAFFDAKIYVQGEKDRYNTFSNTDGLYVLEVPANRSLVIVVRDGRDLFEYPVNLKKDQVLALPKTKFNVSTKAEISIIDKKKERIETLPQIEYSNLPVPGGDIGNALPFLTAASSNNELSSNYNVRGGNYDENLVYVNGFQIYRPFLTRSGQQEGMSFVNSDLVKSLSFSGGGFAANYGDKLSSVLDITYKEPDSLKGSLSASLLGVKAHVEDKVNTRFSYLLGARYRSNGYLLNALPTKGAYNPVFYDVQFLSRYALTENLNWSVIGHFSSNNYRFAPETAQTNFGTVNEAYSFKVYFDGQEASKFRTITGGTSLNWQATDQTKLNFYASIFNTNESENFTIQGQYFINQLETDPGKEEFGDSIATLGVGTFLNHARNTLNATIYALYHDGEHQFTKLDKTQLNKIKKGKINWGVRGQIEDISDKLSEWKMIDSAGYSIPQAPANEIKLYNVIKAHNTLKTWRANAYAMYSRDFSKYKENFIVNYKSRDTDSLGKKVIRKHTDTIVKSTKKLRVNAGVRGGYTAFNKEFYVTPRAGLSYFPIRYYMVNGKRKKRYIRLHASTGLYYQPPFYRELRAFDGTLHTNIKAQKSAHFVTGMDYLFEMWGRDKPFKISAEAFYKQMWDVNPYEIDNVRTRYYTTNNAVAFAYGADVRLNGEFINGIQSFVKLGVLRTEEDLLDDDYYLYLNQAGDTIKPGFTFDNVATDSILQSPGYIPRPTDQWFTFAVLFQDRMPKYERFTVQLGLNYGYKLPYGPPDFNRYKDILRQRAYFRTDIGFGYDFFYNKPVAQRNNFGKKFSDLRINFEIFNLLGINNVLSQQWIQDTQGRFYAIPNYLTSRRLNLKLIMKF